MTDFLSMKGKTQMYVSRGRNQNNNVFLLSKKAKKDCRTGLSILVSLVLQFLHKGISNSFRHCLIL